jgi:hypothetical protein
MTKKIPALTWVLLGAALVFTLFYESVFAGSISGRVTGDPDGQGIQGAQVGVYNKRWKPLYRKHTDSSGNYTVDGLPTGSYYLHTINNKGYIDQFYDHLPVPGTTWPPDGATPVSVTKGSGTPNINFRLPKGGSISGRVTRDSDGHPIKDVTVGVYTSAWNLFKEVKTDVYGSFTASGLPSGGFYVKVTNTRGYIEEYYNNVTVEDRATLVAVKQGIDTPGVNFDLSQGGSISGRIARDSDGVGIEGVEVKLFDTTWKLMRSAHTDSSGCYRMDGLSWGDYYLRTRNAWNYIDLYYDDALSQQKSRSLSVRPGGKTSGINFSLVPGGAISGRVTGEPDGKGLRNIYIIVYDKGWNYVNGAEVSLTGDYTVGKLPKGSYYVQTSNNQGYVDVYYDAVISREKAREVHVDRGAKVSNVDFSLTRESRQK